jgi:hypothetical protein
VTSPDPTHLWAWYRRTVWGSDYATETVLYIPPQLVVCREFRDLRATRPPVGMPLGSRGSVFQISASSRGVPPQFTRDRRRGSAELPRNLTHSAALGMKKSDLFSLGER